MRSRYVAYVGRDADYLLRTWDPAQRPATLDLKNDRTQWLGLRIVSTAFGGQADDSGQVEFIARFRSAGHEQSLRERSRFRRHDGAWLYVDGDALPAPSATPPAKSPKPTAGRNDPCPCGSGQKFKRCCGR